MDKKRTAGVTVCAALMVLFSAYMIYAAFRGLMIIGQMLLGLKLFIIPAIGCLLLAYGLFTLKKWARILTLYLSVIVVLLCCLLVLLTYADMTTNDLRERMSWVLLTMLVVSPFLMFCISFIAFLTRPKIKEQFK